MDSRCHTQDAGELRNAVRRARLVLSRLVVTPIRHRRAARELLELDAHLRDDLELTCADVEALTERSLCGPRIRPTEHPFGWFHDSDFRRWGRPRTRR